MSLLRSLGIESGNKRALIFHGPSLCNGSVGVKGVALTVDLAYNGDVSVGIRGPIGLSTVSARSDGSTPMI